jgi:hypothetical protein
MFKGCFTEDAASSEARIQKHSFKKTFIISAKKLIVG